MSPFPIIVDTNVLVSGMLTAEPTAPTRVIVDRMLSGSIRFVMSVTLLEEYSAVLRRVRIRKLHGLSDGEIDTILVDVAQHAIVLSPAVARTAPDRNDQHLWDLLHAREDLRLVTGDLLLQRSGDFADRILSPRNYVEILLGVA